jgi:hypothetical protein
LPQVDDLPAGISRLLGWPGGQPRTPGAFPFRPEAPPARGEHGTRPR